jgi:hypothetical protein
VSRSVPALAVMVVTPRDTGWETELAYSRQHIEGARYEVRDGAIRVTWRRTDVTFGGFGRDDRRSVEPPSLELPKGAAAGTQWRDSYRTGDITVRTQSRVERRDTLQVDGAQVEVLVIDSRSTTSGAHPGTRNEKIWWAPTLGIPVRWDVDMDIGGVFSFRSRTRLELERTTPDRD